MPACRTLRGLSLMELMVVLLITGVLVSLAWPSYQGYLRRGHRAEAQAALLEAHHFMERHYAVHGRYTTAAGAAPALPVRLQAVPAQGQARYSLSLSEVSADGYVLQAQPQSAMADDVCGSLTLASTGARGRTGTGLSAEACWR